MSNPKLKRHDQGVITAAKNEMVAHGLPHGMARSIALAVSKQGAAIAIKPEEVVFLRSQFTLRYGERLPKIARRHRRP